MAYSQPTYHRSDSQSGFYARTQQQGSFENTGHQNQQSHQSHSSRPRFESRSASSATAPQRELSEFYGIEVDDDSWDEIFNRSKESVEQLRQSISRINNNGLDIDSLINLFGDIKKVQSQGDPGRIREEAPELLAGLSKSVGLLLKKISDDIQSDAPLINSLNADDIHILFNGLSAIVSESASESLLSKSDFNKAKNYLRAITEHLLVQVTEKDFIKKHWDSSSLINVLNWLSRGLKQGILSTKNSILKTSFTQALMLMKDWAPGAAETVGTATLKDPLDTRQLGKCMVQVATALKFGLVTEDAPEHLLRDVVLGLCGGKALTQCTQWQQSNHSSSSVRVLTPVQPNGAEITSISNTVKDCLHAGILSLEEASVQSLINGLCRHMNTIGEHELLERHGQRLANSCNFLREIFEIEHATGKSVLKDRSEYEKACKRLLEQMSKLSPFVQLNEQSIVNLLSFVKAMDKTRSHPTEVLRMATSHLLTFLSPVIGRMKVAESISATLGGLQYLGQRGLMSPDLAHGVMISLLSTIELSDLSRWPAKSRTSVMQAAVYCWQALSDRKSPSSEALLVGLMERLLLMTSAVTERYPYVMAASILMKRDSAWLSNHQSVLGQLLPARAGSPISEADVLGELAQLKAGEPVVEAVVQPTTTTTAMTTLSSTTTTTTTTATTTQTVKAPQQRVPVGMTRVIEPAKSTTTTATNTFGPKPVPAVVDAPSNSWQSPSRVAKAKKGEAVLLPSTEPKLVSRDKAAPAKKVVPENKPVQEKIRTSPPPKSETKSVAKAPSTNKTPKLTPEQEWFQLLKQEKSLSASHMQRLQTLLKATPRLAVSVEGKGAKARSALFYALTTGKSELVSPIMLAHAQVKQDLARTLKLVLDDLLVVDGPQTRALKTCLSELSADELSGLGEALSRQYRPGEMDRMVAGALLEILKEKGVLAADIRQDLDTEAAKLIAEHGSRALIFAARDGKAEIVKVLIDRPSAVKMLMATDASGHNAMHYAISQGHHAVVELLINHASGARQAMAFNTGGQNALMYAARLGHAAIVESLINHASGGEQATFVNIEGTNALMVAAEKGHTAVVELLLNHASAAEQTKAVHIEGPNALLVATQFGHLDIVKLIINHPLGAKQATFVTKADRKNSLMLAAYFGHTAIVELLINHASGVEQARVINNEGENALMVAARFGNPASVELLINHTTGAEQAKVVNSEGKNALMLAVESWHYDDHRKNFFELLPYLQHSNLVKLLINHASGAEQAQVVNNEGENALMVAARFGNRASVESLINHTSGAEQAKVVNSEGKNALMLAVESGHHSVVQSLMNHPSGAEQARVVAKNGFNALMIAQKMGHNGIIKLLMPAT